MRQLPSAPPSRTSRRPARRLPPDEIRAAIVEATIRIIGRGGTAAVTHRAVAEEAGVSLSSTTYHFASKAEIVDAALRQVAANEIARVEATTTAALEHVHDIDSLVDLLTAWLDDQLADEWLVVRAGYELQLEAERSPELEAAHAEWGTKVQELSAHALERAGSPRPREDAHILAALIDGLRLEEITHPRPGVAERNRPLLDRLLRALVAQS
ncbi:MAG TPA: TetR family transcriptional regulator [Solirubrobacteraceae bacterium]|nr:TetR family transcriptional regulator [Solirubrobacteraceae bacterium]